MNTAEQSRQDRQIRVFISSTFRDMQAERDYLVKFVFPELRKLCESRGVTWGEVDLRWGVTDEQAAEGKVLPICLEEIKRCRPYFIGLLGERYGSIPESIPQDVIEREPWLNEHLQGKASVTELEILHGVLRNPEMAGHAYFYFRDPAYVKHMPEKGQKDFVSENARDAEKLSGLKDRIRQGKFPVRENYADPKALGELVLADLTSVINDKWPEGSQPDPLDREALDHEAYAQSRERVYIGRQEYLTQLDAHAHGTGDQPLVILGQSGSGKSALLANWAARYRQAHPDTLVLQHYIGATPYSADWAAMLRRIMGEFKRRLGIQQDIPDKPDALRSAFANWLHLADAAIKSRNGGVGSPLPAAESHAGGAHGVPRPTFSKLILVLDALTQLEDRDGAPDLLWLPPVMPANVRLLVSTLPGRPLDEIRKRQWPTVTVKPLDAGEQKQLIVEYLAQSAKRLGPTQLDRIAGTQQAANPLYLRVLLDELRLFGKHEELDARIEYYLQAESPGGLYLKVIARWEEDYGAGTSVVGDTLSLLWAARRGLTESELLQALGSGGQPLPRAQWSPLFLAMAGALVSRGGLLTFAHDYLRTAARDACIPSDALQQQGHLRLADFFQAQPAGSRRTDELPWQLAEAKAWPRLHGLLADHSFLQAAWVQNHFEVRRWWARLEAGSALRMVTTYAKELEHPESEPDKNYLQVLASLLAEGGHLMEASQVCEHLTEYYRDNGGWDEFPRMLGALAGLLRLRGNPEQAMKLHRESERIARRVGNLRILVAALLGQALILRDRGDWDGAMSVLKEQERICRLSGNDESLAAGQSVQALIIRDRGDLDGAMALHRQSERIARQLGDLDGLQVAFNNQAVILGRRGDLDGAMKLFKEQERICRRLGNLKGVAQALTNEGSILQLRGNLHEAMALQKQAEQACRQLNYPDCLQSVLGAQALILKAGGNRDGALALLKEAEQICRQLGNSYGLQSSLGDQALILLERRNFQRAKPLIEEQERICRQLRHVRGLVTALTYQAGLCGEQGRAMEGLRYAEEACQLAASHGEESLMRTAERLRNALRESLQQG